MGERRGQAMTAGAALTDDNMPAMSPDGRRVRVLIVLCGPLEMAGGPIVWADQLAKAIDGQRFAVDVMDIGAHGFGAKVARHLLTPMWIARQFRKMITRNGPYDVVHLNFTLWDAAILSRLAYRLGIGVRIVHSHTPHPDMGRLWKGTVLRDVARRWVLQYATHLLGVSTEAAAGQLGSAVLRDPRFRLLPAAIDLTSFRQPIAPDVIRASLQIPSEARVVGHVGRFALEKNHVLLVQIATLVLKVRSDVIFLLIGDGELRTTTQQQVQKLGIADHFRFTGERTDVPSLMKGAMDMLLFPSKSEGLPRVVLEAQAAGLTCILSDCVSEETDVIRPLVKRLSLSDSPQLWAEAVLQSLADGPAVSQQEALEAVAASPMNIDNSVRDLEAIYSGGQTRLSDAVPEAHPS